MRQMFDWLQWGLARKRVGGPALGDIANRLNTIRGQDGAAAILHTHYTGTCSLIAGTFPLRFFNRIGATEVDPDTVCNKAGHVALQLMYGESTRGFDPRTIDGTRCVMILGANPSTSAPHVHQYWLSETHVTKIVVDPIRHETAAAANIHLQLHPGTDDALAYMGGGPQDLLGRARTGLGGDREATRSRGALSWLTRAVGRPTASRATSTRSIRAARRTSRRESCAVHSIIVSLVPA